MMGDSCIDYEELRKGAHIFIFKLIVFQMAKFICLVSYISYGFNVKKYIKAFNKWVFNSEKQKEDNYFG